MSAMAQRVTEQIAPSIEALATRDDELAVEQLMRDLKVRFTIVIVGRWSNIT